MKYYCISCGYEASDCMVSAECPLCAEHAMKPIPAYETVAQWEERKGRKYPDTAPTYVLLESPFDDSSCWALCTSDPRKMGLYTYCGFSLKIVATEAGAPPDYWRPE